MMAGQGGGQEAMRYESAVHAAGAASTALRSEPDVDAAMVSDERAWLYQDVTCGRCGAVVQVVKFSPQHTSVQWTADAALTCAEFAAASLDNGAPRPIPACASLRASIAEAVASGQVSVHAP